MQIVHTCEEYDKYPPPRSEAGYILLMITALLLGPAMIYCICKAEAAKRAHGERSPGHKAWILAFICCFHLGIACPCFSAFL